VRELHSRTSFCHKRLINPFYIQPSPLLLPTAIRIPGADQRAAVEQFVPAQSLIQAYNVMDHRIGLAQRSEPIRNSPAAVFWKFFSPDHRRALSPQKGTEQRHDTSTQQDFPSKQINPNFYSLVLTKSCNRSRIEVRDDTIWGFGKKVR